MPQPHYLDRRDAGRTLARLLVAHLGSRSDLIVLALPRGGVPVGYEVALALHAPLDVYTVRKLGVPGHRELAFGAIASDGSCVIDDALVGQLHLDEAEISAVVAEEFLELRRRETLYRGERPFPKLHDRCVILVDDGLATGSSMRVAANALRGHAKRIVIAVPVGAADSCASLRTCADEVICLHQPSPFHAVGLYYADFSQTSDDEVRTLLQEIQRKVSTWTAA